MSFRHIYKSILTTIIGLLVIGLSLWNVYEKDASWPDAVLGLAIGACFLFIPDKMITGFGKIIDKKTE